MEQLLKFNEKLINITNEKNQTAKNLAMMRTVVAIKKLYL